MGDDSQNRRIDALRAQLAELVPSLGIEARLLIDDARGRRDRNRRASWPADYERLTAWIEQALALKVACVQLRLDLDGLARRNEVSGPRFDPQLASMLEELEWHVRRLGS